jgi:hypothetical protein
MDSLDLSAILNPPPLLDCLPSTFRNFSSPLLVAWKFVKTSGQESFSYQEMGRSVHATKLQTSWSLLGTGVEVGLTPSFIDYICLSLK